jgi:hypothetical protein
MNTRHSLASLVVGCALGVVVGAAAPGCDRQPSQPKATTNQPSAPPTAEDVATMRDKAISAGKAATQKTAGAVSDAAADVKNSETMAKVKEQGAELLGKLDAAIKANRLDEAQTYVDAFDKLKANVPDDLKARYESLKTQLSAAKAKATTPQPAPTPAEPNK